MVSALADAGVKPDSLVLLELSSKMHSLGQLPSKSPVLAGTGMNYTAARPCPAMCSTVQAQETTICGSGCTDHIQWVAPAAASELSTCPPSFLHDSPKVSHQCATCFQGDFPWWPNLLLLHLDRGSVSLTEVLPWRHMLKTYNIQYLRKWPYLEMKSL